MNEEPRVLGFRTYPANGANRRYSSSMSRLAPSSKEEEIQRGTVPVPILPSAIRLDPFPAALSRIARIVSGTLEL